MKKIANKNITTDVILEDVIFLVREAILSCYGVVGFINLSNKKGKVEEGLDVNITPEKKINILARIIISKDIKITETIRSCQDVVIYRLKSIFPNYVTSVSIFAEEISSKN